MQFQGVNGWSFSKEGVKNISSVFKLSGSQSVTLEQKQSQGKREKSKSTPGQGGLMHTNGFCHLWLGKIYDSLPQSCKQSTKQQTLAPYGRLRPHNLKGGARGRVGGESRPQKSSRRHFLFRPAGSHVAFKERRRGSIINLHFLLQTADATLAACSASCREGLLSVRTCPGSRGRGRGERVRAGASGSHTRTVFVRGQTWGGGGWMGPPGAGSWAEQAAKEQGAKEKPGWEMGPT